MANFFFPKQNQATKRILVDGASNWLFDNRNEFKIKPDFICGDMDSISEQAMEYFKTILDQSQIVKLTNQDETDFDKTVSFCLEKFKDLNIEFLVVVWGQKDRIDHNLACVSTLIKNCNRNSLQIYLIDISNSLSFVLNGKRKSIKCNPKSKWCSIIPIGEPSIVTTTGFKWNLTDYQLKFGELISTSNEFDLEQNFCTIQTDKPIFFSMHLPE